MKQPKKARNFFSVSSWFLLRQGLEKIKMFKIFSKIQI